MLWVLYTCDTSVCKYDYFDSTVDPRISGPQLSEGSDYPDSNLPAF